VHEVQIDVVETQSSKAPLERPLCPEGFKGEELRGDPDLLSWDAARPDRVADATLVPIEPCGVNVSDTGLERPMDGLLHRFTVGICHTPRPSTGIARPSESNLREPMSRGVTSSPCASCVLLPSVTASTSRRPTGRRTGDWVRHRGCELSETSICSDFEGWRFNWSADLATLVRDSPRRCPEIRRQRRRVLQAQPREPICNRLAVRRAPDRFSHDHLSGIL